MNAATHFLRVHPRCSPFAPNVPTDYTAIWNAGTNLKTAGVFSADGMAE